MIPDARHLPEARTDTIRGAIVVPMSPGAGHACGVVGPGGAAVAQARTLLSGGRFTPDPIAPDGPVARLPGRWLYAGVGRHHFGHFLLECISRLWALDHGAAPFDGIIITPMQGRDIAAVIRRRLGPLLDILGQGLPVHLAAEPVQVDELVVPSQGMGHLHWTAGTPEFRAYVRRHLCAALTPEGPDKLYVSRRRLKSPAKQVPHEQKIERWMSAAGFEIFHPERHAIAVQCQRYMAARQIVGPDGSAFHLAPFVMPRGARVGLIQRRTRQPVFDAIARQITSFAEADLWTTAALAQLRTAPQPDERESALPPELRQLRGDLKQAGFI
ncbi:glycosyltransferase family 61 protein [Roseovarius sp.]|uniref:glycosyltransferase family 61 protein n=2 Tax=Roseovarius TaxID=74030 RepID=UPI003A96E9B7